MGQSPPSAIVKKALWNTRWFCSLFCGNILRPQIVNYVELLLLVQQSKLWGWSCDQWAVAVSTSSHPSSGQWPAAEMNGHCCHTEQQDLRFIKYFKDEERRRKKVMKSEVYKFCFRLSNTGIFYLNVKCFRILE